MHEPEIDVVGTEARERGIELPHQGAPGDVGAQFVSLSGDPCLGAHDEVLAPDVAQHRAQDCLGGPVPVAVCRVDEVAARVDEGPHMVRRVVLVD